MDEAKTLLVTGGLGFIGSALIRHVLATTPYAVVNLDACTYAANPEAVAECADHPRYRFARGDIRDASLVARLLAEERPMAIMHAAAETHVDRSIADPGPFLSTNVTGTHVLLQESLKYWRELSQQESQEFRFINVSTDEVYGAADETHRFKENDCYAPNSPYSASKAAANHFARAYHVTYGLPVITTLCCNNYGPFQHEEKLIPKILLNALRRQPLPVYGDGLHVRDWLYVDDHVRALLCILERGVVGDCYNVGANQETTNIELVQCLCDLVERIKPSDVGPARDLIEFVTDRPGHDRRYAIDAMKLQTELAWHPQESLESGMTQTVKWYFRKWNESQGSRKR